MLTERLLNRKTRKSEDGIEPSCMSEGVGEAAKHLHDLLSSKVDEDNTRRDQPRRGVNESLYYYETEFLARVQPRTKPLQWCSQLRGVLSC